MTFARVLSTVVGFLESSSVPYMVTGSVASSYHGEPRATRDLDIVIDPDLPALERLVGDLLANGQYVDRGAALDAFMRQSQFNAIMDDAVKVDFIVRRHRPFSTAEFERRRPADLLGTPAFVASAEDTIIAKLEWAATTESERQLRDVGSMVAIGGDRLDRAYIERWVTELGLDSAWQAATVPRSG